MSRSGYSDDCEGWSLIRWRGRVASAIRGKRGQAMLRELAVALDEMPIKRLIVNDLESEGEVCTLGSLGVKRGLNMSALDPEEREEIAEAFGVSMPLVAEIAYLNDEMSWNETPEQRWTRMRNWVAEQVICQGRARRIGGRR